MPKVYPRAPETKDARIPLDSEAACAARVILAKDAGKSRAEAAGVCLAGADDVQTYNRLWSEVDAQVVAARAVSPADHDTATKYKAAVSAAAPLLDVTKWYDGLKAEKEVGSFTELTAKVEELAEPVEE